MPVKKTRTTLTEDDKALIAKALHIASHALLDEAKLPLLLVFRMQKLLRRRFHTFNMRHVGGGSPVAGKVGAVARVTGKRLAASR